MVNILDPADLELELVSFPDDPIVCRADMRFRLPDSDVEIDLLKGYQPIVRFQPEALIERQASATKYGETLGEMLFADANLLAAWREVYSVSQSHNRALRLRLFLTGAAASLHTLRWETLIPPGDSGFITQTDYLFFSRYLPSRDRRPITPFPAAQMTALVVIASPSQLGSGLAPVDATGELTRARASLGDMPILTLHAGEHVTLNALETRLSQGAALLYLVCHGQIVRGEPYLALEDEQGAVAWTAGGRLAERLAQLSVRPRLVVLAACQSAGTGDVSGNPALAAIGPLLVDAGVPAVVAVQGNISMRTVARMMPVFFSELRRHGIIDLALATARRRTQDQADWWAPALFMRLKSGHLFAGEGAIHPDARPIIQRRAWEPETILIPGGAFLMGSDDPLAPPAELPQHWIELPAFRMGKYPVTIGEFAVFVKETRAVVWASSLEAKKKGWFNLEPPQDKLNQPVSGVSWWDAMDYCRWLSAKTGRRYTLPSEAEWEKAAGWCVGMDGAASVKRRYPWGDAWQDGLCNVDHAQQTPVTAHPEGASAYGVEDLCGNVQEWTRSLWGDQPGQPKYGYPYDPADGREAMMREDMPVQMRLVHRGGLLPFNAVNLRCTARGNALPDSRIAWRGFRVAMLLNGT